MSRGEEHAMTIEIKSITGVTLYASTTATTLREAVIEAVRNGANLRGADLRDVNLSGVDLRGASLHGVNLGGADLRGVNLYGASLYGASLYGVNLSGADLRGVDLRGVNLYGVNLSGADLRGASLGGADLRSEDGITFDSGPSGRGWLIRLDADGKYDRAGEWRITIGCWRDKTLDDLRALIDDEADWPEAEGAERDYRRPYLRAVLALCEAHIAYQAGAAARGGAL